MTGIEARIEELRQRLYNAVGLARAAGTSLSTADASNEPNVHAAACVIEELETLIAEVNDGLDWVNLRKQEVQS